jgi:hypothetical protein
MIFRSCWGLSSLWNPINTIYVFNETLCITIAMRFCDLLIQYNLMVTRALQRLMCLLYFSNNQDHPVKIALLAHLLQTFPFFQISFSCSINWNHLPVLNWSIAKFCQLKLIQFFLMWTLPTFEIYNKIRNIILSI